MAPHTLTFKPKQCPITASSIVLGLRFPTYNLHFLDSAAACKLPSEARMRAPKIGYACRLIRSTLADRPDTVNETGAPAITGKDVLADLAIASCT